MSERHFRPALFTFLRQLKTNNDRDWFLANKERYQRTVKDPALAFVVDFGAHLHRISPHFLADPRPVGGAVYRIYRDLRFSKDKRPYKTHAGMWFPHERHKEVRSPGFYLHLEPGGMSFVGLGIWHPDNASLRQIRAALDTDQEGWLSAVANDDFSSRFQLTGRSLVRPPKGYGADHPLIETLKLKDFTAAMPLTQKQITGGGFMAEFSRSCAAGAPLVKFLCRALGLNF